MNWVGGARKRICKTDPKKARSQRKLQKEYFEKRRHGMINLNAVGRIQSSNFRSKENPCKISQDLLEFQDYVQQNEEGCSKSKARAAFRVVNLNSKVSSSKSSDPANGKYVSVEMPLSPVGQPSTLFLSHSPSSTIDLFGTTMKKPKKPKLSEEMPPPTYGVNSVKAQRKNRISQREAKKLISGSESDYPPDSSRNIDYFPLQQRTCGVPEHSPATPLNNLYPTADIKEFNDFQIVPSQSILSMNSIFNCSSSTAKANDADESELETSSNLFKMFSPLRETDISMFRNSDQKNDSLSRKSTLAFLEQECRGFPCENAEYSSVNKRSSFEHHISSDNTSEKQNTQSKFNNFLNYLSDVSDCHRFDNGTSHLSITQNKHFDINHPNVIPDIEPIRAVRDMEIEPISCFQTFKCLDEPLHDNAIRIYNPDMTSSTEKGRFFEEANVFQNQNCSLTQWNDNASKFPPVFNMNSVDRASGQLDMITTTNEASTSCSMELQRTMFHVPSLWGMSKSTPVAYHPPSLVEPVMTSTPSHGPICLNKETLDIDMNNHKSKYDNTLAVQNEREYPIHDLLHEMIDLESQTAPQWRKYQDKNTCLSNHEMHDSSIIKELLFDLVSKIEQRDMNSTRKVLEWEHSQEIQIQSEIDNTVYTCKEKRLSLKGNNFPSVVDAMSLSAVSKINEYSCDTNINSKLEMTEEGRLNCIKVKRSSTNVPAVKLPHIDMNPYNMTLGESLPNKTDQIKANPIQYEQYKEAGNDLSSNLSQSRRLGFTLDTNNSKQIMSIQKQKNDRRPVDSFSDNVASAANCKNSSPCKEKDLHISHDVNKTVTISTQTVTQKLVDTACSPILILPPKDFDKDNGTLKRTCSIMSRVYSLRPQPRAFYKDSNKKEE